MSDCRSDALGLRRAAELAAAGEAAARKAAHEAEALAQSKQEVANEVSESTERLVQQLRAECSKLDGALAEAESTTVKLMAERDESRVARQSLIDQV